MGWDLSDTHILIWLVGTTHTQTGGLIIVWVRWARSTASTNDKLPLLFTFASVRCRNKIDWTAHNTPVTDVNVARIALVSSLDYRLAVSTEYIWLITYAWLAHRFIHFVRRALPASIIYSKVFWIALAGLRIIRQLYSFPISTWTTFTSIKTLVGTWNSFLKHLRIPADTCIRHWQF